MNENQEENIRSLNQEKEEGDRGKTYKLRHNKTDVELSFDELIKNAEKGLDYDRIRPSHELVKKLALRDGDGDISHFIARMNGIESLTEDDKKSGKETEAPQNPQNKEETDTKEKEVSEERKNETDPAFKKSDIKRSIDENELLKANELCRKLQAKIDTMNANSINSEASIGAINGTETDERAFYTSKEWDALESNKKQKLIKNGKIFEFMKKWSGK